MTQTALILLIGMLVGVAVLLGVSAFQRPMPQLAAALDNITSLPSQALDADEIDTSGFARVGTALMRFVQPTAYQRAQLKLRGITPAQWYGRRLLGAVILGCVPTVYNLLFTILGLHIGFAIPALLTIVLALLGWMYPALAMRRQSSATNDDTLEALLVFIDLVVLERLSNASAVQALTNAAMCSEAPLFLQIRRALNRAALENVAPWSTLNALADEIQLPALRDVIAIAQLQEEGAGLSEAFRARVDELRNAHLMQVKKEAIAVTQRMDIIKAIPTVAVVVLMVAAPLLKIMTT